MYLKIEGQCKGDELSISPQYVGPIWDLDTPLERNTGEWWGLEDGDWTLFQRGEGLSCEAVLWEKKQVRISEGCLGKAHVSFRKFGGAVIVAIMDREGIMNWESLGTVSVTL